MREWPIVTVHGLSPNTLLALAANAVGRWIERLDGETGGPRPMVLVALEEHELELLAGMADGGLGSELRALHAAMVQARTNPFVRRPQG